MTAIRNTVLLFALTMLLLITRQGRGDEQGKVTSTFQYLTVSGGSFGFCGMTLLEIDEKPAASFGLHQSPGGKPRFTYLLLFKPDPKRDRGGGVLGDGESSTDSDGNVSCDLKMKALATGREIAVEYKVKASAKAIETEMLKVGGKEYGKDGPRVFLIDLADDKLTPQAIKITPQAVPEFNKESEWGRQILAAIKELKEKSPEAKAFFGGEAK